MIDKYSANHINSLIGLKFRNLRYKFKLTQQQVTDGIGIDRVSVVNIESGRHGLSTLKLIVACVFFRCMPNDLIPNIDELSGEQSIPNLKTTRSKEVTLAKIAAAELKIKKRKESLAS